MAHHTHGSVVPTPHSPLGTKTRTQQAQDMWPVRRCDQPWKEVGRRVSTTQLVLSHHTSNITNPFDTHLAELPASLRWRST